MRATCGQGSCRAACKGLGAFLRNSSGGVIIVSHDKDLLQDACDQIVEVRGRQLHLYAGDYNLFLEQRELRSQQAASMALTQVDFTCALSLLSDLIMIMDYRF